MASIDKRKYSRYGCRVPVLCKRGTLFDNSETLDISNGGMGFISEKFIPLDTHMILEISLSPKSEPLLAVGRVKWIQKTGYAERYRVGLAFQDISDDSQNRLKDYIKKTRS